MQNRNSQLAPHILEKRRKLQAEQTSELEYNDVSHIQKMNEAQNLLMSNRQFVPVMRQPKKNDYHVLKGLLISGACILFMGFVSILLNRSDSYAVNSPISIQSAPISNPTPKVITKIDRQDYVTSLNESSLTNYSPMFGKVTYLTENFDSSDLVLISEEGNVTTGDCKSLLFAKNGQINDLFAKYGFKHFICRNRSGSASFTETIIP